MQEHAKTRRHFIFETVAWIGAATVAPLAAAQGAKLTKPHARYQDSPRNGDRCGGCRHFLPERKGCKLVAGDISPDGWCMLYAAQQSGAP